MKKFLSLVLALVMTMSLVTVSAGAEYKDADKIDYNEAVDVLSEIKVLTGDAAGFRPDDTLKRSEAAAIITRLTLGPSTANALSAAATPFSDVTAAHKWAMGYIMECVESGIIAGVGNGKFEPDAQLTGYAYLKMLLCALGYDAEIEGMVNSEAWAVNTLKLAKKVKLLKGNEDAFVGTAPVTRQEAALYALNALQAVMVEYDDKGTNVTINGVVIATGASKAEKVADDKSDPTDIDWHYFLEENFARLDKDTHANGVVDSYGRPAIEWKYKGESIGKYAEEPVLVYTKNFDGNDSDDLDTIEEDLKDAGYKYFTTDGVTFTKFADSAAKIKEYADMTGNGTVVEFYGKTYETATSDYDAIYAVVDIITTAETVGKITKDKAKTELDERCIKIGTDEFIVADKDADDAYKAAKYVEIDNFDEIYDAVEQGDVVAVTWTDVKDSTIVTVELPETVEGKITRKNSDANQIVIDGTTYKKAANGTMANDVKDKVTVYLDEFGYVLKTVTLEADKSDVVFLVDTYAEKDKYGDYTSYARVVTAAGEVVELTLDASPDAEAPAYSVNAETGAVTGAEQGLYTYTTNSDGEAELFDADTTWDATNGADGLQIAKDTKVEVAASLKIGGKRFAYADDVTMVYMDLSKEGAKFKVTTASELEKFTAAEKTYAVLNSDDEIVAIFVGAKAAGVVDSDKLIYVADKNEVGVDSEGKVIKAYVDGEKVDIIVSDPTAVWEGFNTYSINSKGVYELEKYTENVTALIGTFQDKYIELDIDPTAEEDIVLYELADDAVVIDLTAAKLGITDVADYDYYKTDDNRDIDATVVFDEAAKEVTYFVITGTGAVVPEA